MSAKPDNSQRTAGFIHADRYACASVIILVLLTVAACAAFAVIAAPGAGRLLAGFLPQPTPTITSALPGINLALRKPLTVSQALPDFPASFAVDANPDNWWSSGSHPPEWIEIDLGGEYVITQVSLLPSQSPPGETAHRLVVKGTATKNRYVLLHTFEGFTEDHEWLILKLPEPLRGVRFLRIETSSSPSWVGWREIQVISGE